MSPLDSLACALSPSAYLRALGEEPYQWQDDILSDMATRIVINGARQGGKSAVVSVLCTHTAKYQPGSLSIIAAATETQAGLDMLKVKEYMALDQRYPEVKRSSDSEIVLANKSRIVVVPATERSARGYSCPELVIVDEASRVSDIVFTSGIIPFFTNNPQGRLLMPSTPAGRLGFFYRAMQNEKGSWQRYEFRAPYLLNDMTWTLTPDPLEDYLAARRAAGVRAYLSPRHFILKEQQDNLHDMGPLMYRQEYMAEFVEPEDAVFRYEDIEAAFAGDGTKPLFDFEIGAARPEEALTI